MPRAAPPLSWIRRPALGACALLCACATSAPDIPRVSINVFISPGGEPFRGGADAPYPVEAWFGRADADHDGALSEAEFVTDALAFFHKLDLNHDGVLDGSEISAYEQSTAPEILPRIVGLTARDIPPLPALHPLDRPQPASGAEREEPRQLGPAISGAAFFSLLHEDEPVAAADTDFDGKVTQAEAAAAARRRFAMLDLNHDGRLLRSELPKTPAQRLVIRSETKRRR